MIETCAKIGSDLRAQRGGIILVSMHKIRTRRLSIVAVVSFVAFVVVAVITIRSFWLSDGWADNSGHFIALEGGRIAYTHIFVPNYLPSGHLPASMSPDRQVLENAIWGFRAYKSSIPSDPSGQAIPAFRAAVPLWPLLVLLIVAPVRWLRAQQSNEPAFPVITDGKQ